MKFAVAFAILFSVAFAAALKDDRRYSVIYDNSTSQWQVVEGVHKDWIAQAIYKKGMMTIGWDVLDIKSNEDKSDQQQAYAAGYIEGALTQEAIWDAWVTFYNGSLNFTIDPHVANFLMTNYKWTTTMSAANYAAPDEQAFWAQAALVMGQFNGMVAGYNAFASADQQISLLNFLLYESNDDIADIQAAVGSIDIEEEPVENFMYRGHCSALIKLTDDGQNLFTSHVTWSGFLDMYRIYKHYDTPFSLSTTKAPKMSFSSAPGTLESGDDFYITSTDLVILETTNNIFNQSLYQYTTPQTVLYWIRNLVANRMSSSGEEWVKWFAMYNSGTYNNQWMVVDNKLFTPGQPLQPGTLWIAEQIPGYVITGDVTDVLNSTGYWNSYNIPYFPFVYDISGYPAMYAKYGNSFSYSMCPRAQIFRRDHHTVHDLPTMKHIMRYNEWQTDPLSLGNACNSISSRCDLNPPALGPAPFGAIDCKITYPAISSEMEATAICGPTYQSQPVFAWTEEWSSVPSPGQPEVFAFQFETMKPHKSM